VLSIGNELLIGHTLDTNSNWLARQLNTFGWSLQRITLVRDSLDSIPVGIVEALERTPRLLVTLGGLGPTHDDMTLRGLSIAIRRPLVLNGRALELIRKRYERMDEPMRLTQPRKKMAMLPRGAEPLPNPAGTAPGVLVKIGQTTLVSLPGVPREMKEIFKSSIIPILRSFGGYPPHQAYLNLVGIVESTLAPLLENAQRRFPNLYFKSHPRGRETPTHSLIQLHIYTVGEEKQGKINEALAFLVKGLTSQIEP